MAPNLSFAATAAGFPALVLAAVRTTASWRQRRRDNDYYPSVIFKHIMFFYIKSERPTGVTQSHLHVSEVMQAVLTQFVGDSQESCVTNADMVN